MDNLEKFGLDPEIKMKLLNDLAWMYVRKLSQSLEKPLDKDGFITAVACFKAGYESRDQAELIRQIEEFKNGK